MLGSEPRWPELPDDSPGDDIASGVPEPSRFTPDDLAALLVEYGWLAGGSEREGHSPLEAWLRCAADLLGPQASDRVRLANLVRLIFEFDAVAALKDPANQDLLARSGARAVIRELAHRVLDGGDVDSDRFKQIVEEIKQALPYRSRAMFYPIRLALTGRAGEGELDRVILLLDSAAKLNFAVAVKTTRRRMLEFCAALD